MKKRKIQLDITGAGPEHCIAKTFNDGRCPYLCVRRWGRWWECAIFHRGTKLKDTVGTGRLLRWPECIAAEKDDTP
jgi:hypothetical protein